MFIDVHRISYVNDNCMAEYLDIATFRMRKLYINHGLYPFSGIFFCRFCLGSTPVKREKLQVNMNLKDIFVKKKSGLGCT